MKRLKSSMWSLLTQGPQDHAQEAVATETAEVCGEKAFSQTTQTLLKRYAQRRGSSEGVLTDAALVLLQVTLQPGSEPVRAPGLRRSAPPRQREGEFLWGAGVVGRRTCLDVLCR